MVAAVWRWCAGAVGVKSINIHIKLTRLII